MKLIEHLAQKEYAKRIRNQAANDSRILGMCLERYQPEAYERIYENLLEAKRELVTPYVMTDEMYAVEWKKQKEMTNMDKRTKDLYLLSEEDSIITERGERVRSKSEKIIADKLYMMGIPYVYECPIYLKEYGFVYPDFCVLNKRTRKDFFYEHLGMMDNKEYCEKAIKKIECYE